MSKNPSVDSRTIEKLIALFRYETDGRGYGSAEMLGKLFEHAHEAVLNGDFPENPTDAELHQLRSSCLAMGEYLLRGMVAAGHLAAAEAFVEDVATTRRQCEARFYLDREIPLTAEERVTLSAEWDAARARADAEQSGSEIGRGSN